MTRWVAASGGDQRTTLAAVVASVAEARGVPVALSVGDESVEPDQGVLAVDVDGAVLEEWGPWLPGFVREALLDDVDRRRRGVHHTPPDVARTIVAFAAEFAPDGDTIVVGDPCVGGGAFLLAACEVLGGPRAERLRRVVGCDLDPLAVAVTTAALELWADGAELPVGAIVVGDFLADTTLMQIPDLIVGNPPFLSQLRGAAVRDATRQAALRERWPGVGGYVDDSAAFLLASVDLVGHGGAVALIQPTSFLSARDATGVRSRLEESAPLVGLWIDGERLFDAAVDTIAPVVVRGGERGSVQRIVGLDAGGRTKHSMATPESWAPLIADRSGAPPIVEGALCRSTRLGDIATVTSGFRDQFYGLRDAVSERPTGAPRLVTSGLIDPLRLWWGERECRFDRRRWLNPVVDPGAVDPQIEGWVRDRLVPKLLVATQTRVVEVVVDIDGTLVPCTPVVSVEPRSGAPTLWHLAAALSSPVVAALMVRDAAGSAMSADAIRVAAPRLAEVELPAEGAIWDRAADLARSAWVSGDRAQLREMAVCSVHAYGIEDADQLVAWWEARLPVAKSS